MEFRPNLTSSDPFGNHLNDLFHRVDQSLKSRINEAGAAVDLKIQTAEDLDLALENVRNAYKDSLDCTIDKASSAVQEVFNKLNAMVQKFEQSVQEDMGPLIDEAQQLVDSLPFSYYQPKLSYVSRYLVIDDVANHVSLVIFKGNFPKAGTQGFEPSLTVSDHACRLVKSDKQSLTFQVPQNIFKDSPQEHFSYQMGALQVPWDAGWILSNKTQFDYKVCLGALPQIAGQGYVVYLSDDQGKRIEEFEMNWKDSKLLEPKENEKISYISFTDYNKVTRELLSIFSPIDHQPILQYSVEKNGAWKIWAEPPKDLSALSEKIPEEKITVEVEVKVEEKITEEVKVVAEEGVSSTDPVIVQEQTPVVSYPSILGTRLYELYSLLTNWRSSEQSASLLGDAEKLKDQLITSTITSEDAANQIEELSKSVALLQSTQGTS